MVSEGSTSDFGERVANVVSLISSNASLAEQGRKVPDANIVALQETGFFRAFQPKRFGGVEIGADVYGSTAVDMAGACASTAWASGLLAQHAHVIALMSDELQHEIWDADRAALVSSSVAPLGKATPAVGGIRLSGRFGWSSGCDHALHRIGRKRVVPTQRNAAPVARLEDDRRPHRVDNLLWDGDNLVVLDFRLTAVATGMVDFTFLVAQSLPSTLRRERFDDLLDVYLGELSANGVELDSETAIDKYRWALVFGFMWPLGMMGGYDTREPRSRQLAQTMLERSLSAAHDVDALSLYPWRPGASWSTNDDGVESPGSAFLQPTALTRAIRHGARLTRAGDVPWSPMEPRWTPDSRHHAAHCWIPTLW